MVGEIRRPIQEKADETSKFQHQAMIWALAPHPWTGLLPTPQIQEGTPTPLWLTHHGDDRKPTPSPRPKTGHGAHSFQVGFLLRLVFQDPMVNHVWPKPHWGYLIRLTKKIGTELMNDWNLSNGNVDSTWYYQEQWSNIGIRSFNRWLSHRTLGFISGPHMLTYFHLTLVNRNLQTTKPHRGLLVGCLAHLGIAVGLLGGFLLTMVGMGSASVIVSRRF